MTTSRTIVQIVPRRSTSPEGVGDYARLLAERLLQQHGMRTIFIAATPLPAEQRLHDEWETHELNERSAREMLKALVAVTDRHQAAPVVLHLSGYGYHVKGAPLWLSSALDRWKRDWPATPLVTVFHELFATGPIWGSAFWLKPVQKHVAKCLVRASDAALVTTEISAAWLDRWKFAESPAPRVMPVFSNIGHSPNVRPASARRPTLVIFGRAGIYDAVYRKYLPLIAELLDREGVEEIIDIGRRSMPPPSHVGSTPVQTMGEMEPALLATQLANARFGLINYNEDLLAKSGIFAAYCAQGVIPVCISDQRGYRDGLQPGRQYLALGADDRPAAAMTTMAMNDMQSAACDWYAPHSLDRTSAVLAAMLGTGVARGVLNAV